MIFVSHDLALVSMFCDRLMVMKAGRITEAGDTWRVLGSPQDDYTKQLLGSMTAAVAEYVGKTEQFDDLTMMAVRLLDLPKTGEKAQNVAPPEEKDHKK